MAEIKKSPPKSCMKKMHPIVNNYISNPHETILLQPRDAIKKSELGQKSVHFNELVEERIISETKKDDYMPEKEEQNPRVEVDTMEKCNEELDRVLLKYNELAVLSKKGVNVIEELDLLKNRILILRAIKELILKKKHLEIKISNNQKNEPKMNIDQDYYQMLSPPESPQTTSEGTLNGFNTAPTEDKPDFDLHSILFNHVTKPTFQVCLCTFMFSDFQKFKLLKVLKPLGDKHQLNVSIINVFDRSKLELCPFIKLVDFGFELPKFERRSYEDFRSIVANLGWKQGTVKMFVNLSTDTTSHLSSLLKRNGSQVEDLLRFHNIVLYLAANFGTEQMIDWLVGRFNDLKAQFFENELVNLKRFPVEDSESFNEFLSNRYGTKTIVDTEQIPSHDVYRCIKTEWHKNPEIVYSKNLKIDRSESNRPFRASDFSRSVIRILHRSYLPPTTTPLVCYSEKLESKTNHDNIYIQMIDIHTTAKSLAEVFNETVKASYKLVVADVYFFRPNSSQIPTQSCEFVKETFASSSKRAENIELIVDAFSHFSYLFTNSEILVTSLRTVCDNKERICLDEPVIFSSRTSRKKFGSSDLGELGIERFFKRHVCSNLCKSYLDRLNKMAFRNFCQ